jgi:hypothetical protein
VYGDVAVAGTIPSVASSRNKARKSVVRRREQLMTIIQISGRELKRVNFKNFTLKKIYETGQKALVYLGF